MKKRYTLIIIAILSFLVTSIIVYAHFHTSADVENEFTLTNYNINLVEEYNGTFGERIVKIVNSETTGSGALIRVNYAETWTNGTDILSNEYGGRNVVTKTFNQDFLDYFVDGGDGWYYYTKVLNPTEEVQLLNSIELIEENYQKYDYGLTFHFEAVQASREAALSLFGKTAIINGGDVSWTF